RRFRLAANQYEIVGVGPKGFIGTEPGAVADIFVPTMMKPEALNSPGWTWFRIWVRPKPGYSPEQVRQPLQADFTRVLEERARNRRGQAPQATIDDLLKDHLEVIPAAWGASDVQRQFRRPLLTLGALVALVLLIACTNIGNLLTAQSASRAREMA